MLKFTQYSLVNSQSIGEGMVGRTVEMTVVSFYVNYYVIWWNSIEKECTGVKILLDNQQSMWLTVMAFSSEEKEKGGFLSNIAKFCYFAKSLYCILLLYFFLWTVVKVPEWNFVKEKGILLLMVLADSLAQFSVFVCVPGGLHMGWLYVWFKI